ncbi:M56 family metallopeptidase [Chondrinema litorale]|uniref:M56 family metallopeptidase n=1 Tax=Chondrinema litorale TaxID=2994555 RepID=UPI002543F56F|nr:M56 family metallopeptidase [Chondrinema litorale]UZR98778.1 hypothetical protein OQ292_33565 [Chondrinema litorale]
MHLPVLFDFLIESSLCLFILYLAYWCFFRNLTHFHWNRIYLLAVLFLCFLLPALDFPIEREQTGLEVYIQDKFTIADAQYNKAQSNDLNPSVIHQEEDNQQIEPQKHLKDSPPTSSTNWWFWLGIVYALGVVFFTLKLLLAAWQLMRLISKNPKEKRLGFTLVIIPEHLSCFSFFNWIFTPEYLKNEHRILAHELIHVRRKHSLDVLLVEIAAIFQWFNPAIYLLKKSLQQVHEYQADAVASDNTPKKYAKLLLANAIHHSKFMLTNSFAFLPLKKRIVMLTKKKSSGNSRWKYTLSLPVFLSLFMVFSCTDEKDILEEAFLNGAGIKSVKVIYEDQYGDSPNRNGKVIDMIQLGIDGKLVEPELEVNNFYSKYLMREQDVLEFDLSQNKEIVWILDDNVAFGNILALHSEHLPRYILTFDEEWLRMKNYAGGKAIYKNTVGSDSKFQINGDGLPTELKTYSGDERLLEKQSFQYGSNGKLSQADFEVHPHFIIEGRGKPITHTDTYAFSYNPEDRIEYYYKDNLSAKLIYDGERVVEKYHYKDGHLINRLKFEYEAGFRTKALAYNKGNTLEYTLDYQYEFYN